MLPRSNGGGNRNGRGTGAAVFDDVNWIPGISSVLDVTTRGAGVLRREGEL